MRHYTQRLLAAAPVLEIRRDRRVVAYNERIAPPYAHSEAAGLALGGGTLRNVMTHEEALDAVYFDFECTGGTGSATPHLLSWYCCSEPDAGSGEESRVFVLQPELSSAAGITVPQSGGRCRLEYMELEQALEDLLATAEVRNAPIASWSTHDIITIVQHASSAISTDCADCWVDAKDTAKRWYRLAGCPVNLPEGPGRHTLGAYLRHFGWSHPPKFGSGVAADGIQTMIRAIREHGSYGATPSAAKQAFKASAGHNFLDSRGTYLVAVECARRLEAI